MDLMVWYGLIVKQNCRALRRQPFLLTLDLSNLLRDKQSIFRGLDLRSAAKLCLTCAVIERVSGQSYSDYVTEHVFEPAGMDDTGFPDLVSHRTILPWQGSAAGGENGQ